LLENKLKIDAIHKLNTTQKKQTLHKTAKQFSCLLRQSAERKRNSSTTIPSQHGAEDFIKVGLCSVLRPLQHSVGYMGDGFYRSKDPTNNIKELKENLQKTNQTTETTQNTHA